MSSNDLFFKSVDVMGHKGRSEGSHLIEYAAHGPDITFSVVGEI